MAYNPSVKNQENGDGYLVINGDGKCCLKIGVHISR